MKMEKLTAVLQRAALPCLTICLCTGWDSREWAETWGARASVEVRVVDEEGGAVSNAEVEVYFGLSVREGATIKGKTNDKGMFAVKGKTTGEIYINAKKKGFYDTSKKIDIAGDENRKVSWGKWNPDEISCRIVLRPIRKPVDIITSGREKGHLINEPRIWMGFDIEKDDWVPPYGNGVITDFEVMYDSDGKKLFDYTGSTLKIRFVRKFDGAYVRRKNCESVFQVDHEARTNECYLDRFEFSEKKIARRKWDRNILSEEQFLVLRVRSQVDEEGRFKGAHYGMILGPMSFGWDRQAFGCVGLHTFFNTTFNDTSLEKKSFYNTPNFRRIGGLD